MNLQTTLKYIKNYNQATSKTIVINLTSYLHYQLIKYYKFNNINISVKLKKKLAVQKD